MRYTLALFQTHPLALFRFCGKFQGIEYALLPNREWNQKNKNIKNSLGATWNASHLAVRLCALRHWKRVSMPPTTQSHPPPSYEGPPHCPKDKNRSPFHGKKPMMIKWFLGKRLYLPKTILHGRDAILRVRIKWLISNALYWLYDADVKYRKH